MPVTAPRSHNENTFPLVSLLISLTGLEADRPQTAQSEQVNGTLRGVTLQRVKPDK